MDIAVGLSGGVDSAVTAALLKREGHNIIGVSMSIWEGAPDENPDPEKNACYGPDEKEDLDTSREIAEIIGIPFHVFPIPRQYENTVLEHFRTEYAEGRTPNPCVICNAKMKFGALMDSMLNAGFSVEKIATGHYARIIQDPKTGLYSLHEARDKKKDQTYFLHRLKREKLASIMFPLGDMLKEEVRALAREFALPVHDKKDSKGFFSGDYRTLLDFPETRGPIIDMNGNSVGEHSGLWNFTIGQRKGLNLENHSLFVIRLDKKQNAVIVGEREHLYHRNFICRDMNWLQDVPPEPIEVDVKISNTHPRAAGILTPMQNGNVELLFSDPQVAIAPGQSAVFYLGEIVLGGGFITKVLDL